MKVVKINTPDINLDQFLKWAGVATTGGEAKLMIKSGDVKVNGAPEFRRSRKLQPGDTVEAQGRGIFKVE